MKKPIVLLMNDLHVDKDNVSEFEKNWREAISICKKHSIKEIIIGGDLWTSRSSQTLSTLLAVKQAFKAARVADITLTIIEGNHDKVEQELKEGYSHIFVGNENIEVIDDWDIIEYSTGLVIAMICYFPAKGSFTKYLDELKKYLSDCEMNLNNVILYIHQGIHGALGNMDAPDELPQDIFGGFKAVLVG